MVPDQKEWALEQAGEWDAGKAAAERWAATAPEQARAAIASARNVERQLRTRQAFPAFRYVVRNAASR
jgi:hypothetical protein